MLFKIYYLYHQLPYAQAIPNKKNIQRLTYNYSWLNLGAAADWPLWWNWRAASPAAAAKIPGSASSDDLRLSRVPSAPGPFHHCAIYWASLCSRVFRGPSRCFRECFAYSDQGNSRVVHCRLSQLHLQPAVCPGAGSSSCSSRLCQIWTVAADVAAGGCWRRMCSSGSRSLSYYGSGSLCCLGCCTVADKASTLYLRAPVLFLANLLW